MTLGTLIRRSLRFHWRAHMGVVLGAAVGSAALIGALVVGDSVKESLRERALQRLSSTYFALDSGDRSVTDSLARKLIRNIGNQSQTDWSTRRESGGGVASMYHTSASVVNQTTGIRANKVNLYVGVPPAEWSLPYKPGPGWWCMFDDPEKHNPRAQAEERELETRLRAEAVTNKSLATLLARNATKDQTEDSAYLNETLATQLQARIGDTILLRFAKPSALAADAAISPRNEQSVSIRQRVGAIVTAEYAGNFDLRASQVAPFNVFISRHTLTNQIRQPFRASTLAASWVYRDWPRWCPWWLLRFAAEARLLFIFEPRLHSFDVTKLNQTLRDNWTLDDAPAELRTNSQGNLLELRTERVFLDRPLAEAALLAGTNSAPILTLLANLICAGTNTTPYSMVTAAGSPWTPADMRDDEILVGQWLADDLQLKPGDDISLIYFDPESGARLVERTNTFRMRGVVPMELPWADRTLMPDFPGIEKAESTSDWDAGFPLAYKIRQKDEDYWKHYRGTPKAFITLAAGQKIWANRFGNLTSIRFPVPTNDASTLTPALSLRERENLPPISGKTETAGHSTAPEHSVSGRSLSPLPAGEGQGEGERPALTNKSETPHVVAFKEALEKKVLANLKPEELGLRFEPVREQALKAAEESQDFGGLFLGFSFFLIAAALLLMALLFSLGLEQRAPEIGTLLALGFTPKQVRKLLLCEGVALSFLGGVLGAIGGLAYAQAMLYGLTTIWRDAVGASALSFHFTGQTVIIGLFASVVVSVVTIWLTLRKFVRRPARELLVGEIATDESNVQSLKSKAVAVGALLLLAVGLVGWAVMKGDTSNAGAFFGAGALVLVAGMSFASALLRRRTGVAPVSNSTISSDGSRCDACPTLASLALRGCARRRKRSLATVAMLACGSFLIVSIGGFRLDANRDAWRRSSGTGGFVLIGETTMPVVHDLNSPSGRDFFALNEKDLMDVSFVPFRVREGDEASCLNLNRAQKPRLLGVKPEMLEGRFGFAKGGEWKALRVDVGQASRQSPSDGEEEKLETGATPVLRNEVPAIGDANSIQWAMHKKVGDTIDYVDERGQPFKVRIVGAVANSILQGSLIIDEAEFVKRFPGESGYRMFLIDAPSNRVAQVSATLSRAMQDVGLELTPTAARLAQFNAVQNTYLGTFQVLGGLGLLLGSVGLGIVVLRNVLERRGELAVLIAVGFRKATLQRLLLIENGALLAAGLTLGIVAAAVAVLPALLSPNTQLPFGSLALTLGAVLVNGALWTWVATRLAVRGDLLKALRNE
jgi:ABC-type antimicrobial peptide transport system permease subunit